MYNSRTFLGICRSLLEKVIPETSFLYKFLYLNAAKFNSKKRNVRKKSFIFKYHIVDSCNLNCKGCSTFSPLIRKNSFVDKNVFEKDIKRIAELGQVEMIEFIGGEPLLYPNVEELFDIARVYVKTGKLVLVSNGVLILKQDINFWESCKKNEIAIKITPYPINLNHKEIDETARKYGIEFSFYYADKKNNFVKTSMNIEGKASMINSFEKCMSSNCATLRDGKMYVCYRPYCVSFFNEYFGQDFKISKKDYIDIYAVENADEILDFVCKPIPFCRYCDMDNMKFGIPWGISKKEITEWM